MHTVRVYRAGFGDCPYLSDRSWVTDSFHVSSLSPATYERLLSDGWRRSGRTFYRNQCPGCRACIPIRIPAAEFAPSRSQRRVVRSNGDLTTRILPASFREESFQLYAAYVRGRHRRETAIGRSSYIEFLCDSSVVTAEMQYRLDDRLVGIGWLDILPDGLSSVYYAFEPEFEKRSLGTYSIVREIEETRRRGLTWYYLGFYVPGASTMDYKARFFPHELLLAPGRWVRVASPEELAKTVDTWNPFIRPS
jgi:arginine-tRNA-protein transferase